MAKAKAKAKSGSGGTGRGHGGSGVTAAPLPPQFVMGRKVRAGEYIVVFKRGEGESESTKVSVAATEDRIKNNQGNIEELQWFLDQCENIPDESDE